MKPFKARCGEIARNGYFSSRLIKGKRRTVEVHPTECEKEIWFEPSLQPGIAVGKCPISTHNPVYRKTED